ncbi:uncharacterized protein LOC132752766 [Ruditapes philippinarum]|uniref:uncharacterized protein LOC132752766 n=1 Tax=Ruditapes philippinarum TaxID=129788 RepID=UPI00295BDDA5|nr:uncharacterized protein LOC132752766 [Ruditapes philippinarum]
MPYVSQSPANFTDEHKPKGCYNISTLLPLATTTSLKNKFLTTENVFFDNVAITSLHLNTEYPAVKDLDSHKLKSAKHDDTSGKVFFDNFETIEKNDSQQVGVQPEELEVIIDDDDDESPFGILSVYCRSGIHSR